MDENGNSALVYSWGMEFDAETYSKSLNGTEIKNQLSGSDPNLYYGEEVVKFLSRQDWEGTWPTGDYKLKLTAQMATELDNRFAAGLLDEFVLELEEKTGRD